MCKICKWGDWLCHTLNLIKLHQVHTMQQRSLKLQETHLYGYKNYISLHFPMATNSFPLPSKLISIILILYQWFPARKTLNNIIIFFFSEIYILKYLSPLFLLNTLFVNWKLSFLYWELNSSEILTDLLWVLEIDHGSTRYTMTNCQPGLVAIYIT